MGAQDRRVALVDDDQVYQALFSAVGKSMGIPVRTYSSLAEMVSFAKLRRYDLVLIDYHLECFKGTEIAEYVDIFFPDLPVFLISADEDVPTRVTMPASVKKFFCKSHNPYDILKDAVSTLESLKYYEDLREGKRPTLCLEK